MINNLLKTQKSIKTEQIKYLINRFLKKFLLEFHRTVQQMLSSSNVCTVKQKIKDHLSSNGIPGI